MRVGEHPFDDAGDGAAHLRGVSHDLVEPVLKVGRLSHYFARIGRPSSIKSATSVATCC